MAKHRMLIVGVGSIGERHTRTFQQTGRVDLALCESNEQLRKTVAERYGITESHATLDQALNDGKFEFALICTPSHLHIPMATQLVKAGKHVFIEKPLSLTLDGIADLLRLIKEKGVKSAVAYTYRSHPALRSMKEAIDSGRFGEPVQVIGAWGQHFPKYRPAYREIYYTSRKTGGGAIQDVLTHAINAGEFLVGPVNRLMADCGHQVLEGVTVEDTVHVITRHNGDRVMGCFSLNQHQAPNENAVTVVCKKGTCKWDLNNARWLSMAEPEGGWKTEFEFSRERDDIFVYQANLFLDAMEGKGKFACTLEEGLQTLRVNLTILQAADKPNWVPLVTL
ncbi:MAG TPA: Gfo/Idh/MocA family oxidoreductase [Phycisphaerae bacterium]|nr:Gfo/Idh/MocA family oxidoreductase [Phycisphaerae bacterium]